MGGEGAISGMIESIRYNRKLLARNRQKRKDAFNALKDTSKSGDIKLDFKKLSPEELENFKLKVREDRRRANARFALFLIVFMTITVVLLVLMLKFLGIY